MRNTTEDRIIAKIDAERNRRLNIKPATATIQEIVSVKREHKAKRVPIVPLANRVTIGQRTAYLEREDSLRKDMQWKSLMSNIFTL